MQDHQPIIVDNSVDSMGNGDNSGIGELVFDHGLNEIISSFINGSSSFIHDQYPRPS
jgi:hypothetical protein